jgi:hypothetical protein
MRRVINRVCLGLAAWLMRRVKFLDIRSSHNVRGAIETIAWLRTVARGSK